MTWVAGSVTVGHPKGVVPIDIDVTQDGDDPIVTGVTYYRNVRLLMDGIVYHRPPERLD